MNYLMKLFSKILIIEQFIYATTQQNNAQISFNNFYNFLFLFIPYSFPMFESKIKIFNKFVNVYLLF